MTQKAGETYQDIKEKAGELTEKAKSTVRDASAGADLYVHEYAWTSVALVALMALGIGYLLGRKQS